MTITFPRIQSLDVDRMVVAFPADQGATRIICRISWEALQDNFRGVDIDPLQCFIANRGAIEAKAENLIATARLEPDGSVLIRTSDGP